MAKERLDVALVRLGLAVSREKAQAQILAGQVYVDGRRCDKAALAVEADSLVEMRSQSPYVSRGGHKLEKALRVFEVDAAGLVAMDIGAATGGFTDVLLKAGCQRVYAIDVGYGQLDWQLRNDPRVCVMERTNARYLTPEAFPLRPSLCVMDVSFISISLILPAAAAIMGDMGRFIALIKPQFEAGRERVGKKGVVRDPAVHGDVIAQVQASLAAMGWQMRGLDFSPITGPEGNIEFLMDAVARKHGGPGLERSQIEETVALAHRTLDKKGDARKDGEGIC